MRPRLPDRVIGLYPDGRLYRLIYVEGGKRLSLWFSSEEEAKRQKRKLENQLVRSQSKTVGELIDEYMNESLTLGHSKPETISDCSGKVRMFLRSFVNASPGAVTVKKAQAIYDNAVQVPTKKTGKPLAAATHRYYLILANRFFTWLKTNGHVQLNPFEKVKPVGRVNVGKPQLRIEEARSFVKTAIELYEQRGDLLALGVLLALSCGLRVSEVRLRRIRDLDDGGRVLWITSGKSRNAKRNPIVPTFLRPYLLRASAGRPADAYLFGENKARPGEPRARQAFNAAVLRICERAGVPRVCPHSLRGLWATLAVEAGTATEAVASALGHGSFAMTARHYAQPSAIQSVKTARVLTTLGIAGEGTEDPAPPSPPAFAALQAQLAQLDPASLNELLGAFSQKVSFGNRSGEPPERNFPSRNGKSTALR